MFETIKHKKQILAILIRTQYKTEGIKFFSPEDFPQQIGYMNHKSGYNIKPHMHNSFNRKINLTQETLYIKSGKLRVDFYNNDQSYLKSKILFEGDFILLASGGHGFKVLESCEIIEIKQGPYNADIDKVRFEGISDKEVKI